METIRRAVIAVLGCGPAGWAAAIQAARAGASVLLIRAGRQTKGACGEALPAAARMLLRDLGVLPAFLKQGYLPCRGKLSCWNAEIPVEEQALRDPHGCGWHIDREQFDSFLQEQAEMAGVGVLTHKGEVSTERIGDLWRMQAGEEKIQSAWLIDATGRGAALARRFGVRRIFLDKLVAVGCHFRASVEADQDTRLVIEAVEGGWWYAALLPCGTRQVTFFTDHDLLDRRMLSARGFAYAISKTTYLRGVLRRHGHQAATIPTGSDARSSILEQFSGPGWLAAGDAAMAFDPLSSQGLFTALYCGMYAAGAILAYENGLPDRLAGYGAHLNGILRGYWRNRSRYYAAETRWPAHTFWLRRRSSNRISGTVL